nr:ABC transporter ATP-binding protein [uncultured Duganella sp.]
MHPVLSVSGLKVGFRSDAGLVEVVRDVSFQVGRGEIFAVIGESGSGKSTMANAVMGLLPSHAEVGGAIELDGMPISALPSRQRRRLCGERLALISQDALTGLNPCTTVGFQIAETLMVHRGESKRAAMARAVELLSLTGIPSAKERAHHYPHQFSGGMRQRVLIAIALALQPDVLIADEPTTALDATIKAQILQLLMRLREELGMAVLLITHDMGAVAKMADRMLVMYAGRAVEAGPVPEVFAQCAHPYTKALLNSIPRLDRGDQRLQAITGTPPSPANLPSGCSFNPRCAMAADICRERLPLPRLFGDARLSVCHFAPQEVADVVLA